MQFNFAAIIYFLNMLVQNAAFQNNFAFRIVNQARTPDQYLLATFLPEELRTDYVAASGGMTIYATMAGMSGMDSPYAKGGHIESDQQSNEVTKVTNALTLQEKQLREIHAIIENSGLNVLRNGGNLSQARAATNTQAVEALLNVTNLLILQGHFDTFEGLRGQLVTTGKIDWIFNGIPLKIDYKIPNKQKIVRSGTESYYASGSKWWADVATAKRLLPGGIVAVLLHPNTYDAIVSNPANQIIITDENDITGTASFVRNVGAKQGNEPIVQIPSADGRERITVVRYGAQGSVINSQKPEELKNINFIPEGFIVFIGNNDIKGFRLSTNQGSQNNAQQRALRLGYTHIAPTIEGQGRPGRWGRIFTPEGRPYQLQAEGVTNGLPMLENKDKLVILKTDMP